MDYEALYDAVTDGRAGSVFPSWADAFLGRVTGAETELAAVRHPLGFLCFPAWRGDGYGICVHVWNERITPAPGITSTVHAHSWDLLSFVLYGTLCNETIMVTDEAEAFTHRVFDVHSGPDGDLLHGSRRLVRCRGRLIEQHEQGDVYTLSAGVFHSTTVHGKAATVAIGRDLPGGQDRSLGAPDTADHRMRRQLYSALDTRMAAAAVRARLVAAHSPIGWEDPCERGRPLASRPVR
jgi:hypothetical protein